MRPSILGGDGALLEMLAEGRHDALLECEWKGKSSIQRESASKVLAQKFQLLFVAIGVLYMWPSNASSKCNPTSREPLVYQQHRRMNVLRHMRFEYDHSRVVRCGKYCQSSSRSQVLRIRRRTVDGVREFVTGGSQHPVQKSKS